MDDTIFYTIILGTFLFFFLISFIIYMAVFQNKKKSFFKQEILRTRLEIQEQTFNTISQEIHDNVGQILSLVKVQLNIMDENEVIDRSLLTDAQENVSKAMTDLRDIAKGLNSERIRLLGLAPTVEQEIQRINRTGIVHVNMHITGVEKKIDGQKELVLFRIIQECLQNIIKHAAASSVNILLSYQGECMDIVIADNGKGFNFHKEQLAHHGIGLQNIFKRIDLIGGKAAVNSVLQKGTEIKLNIPYE